MSKVTTGATMSLDGGGEIARQCFDAGLLDEVHADLAPVAR